MDKVELNFMVVPEHLELYGVVLNPVRCKIIDLDKIGKYKLLGESGYRLAKAGAEFYINQEMAEILINRGIAKKV